MMNSSIASEALSAGPIIGRNEIRRARSSQWGGERTFDILVGLAGLILAAPLFLVVAALIKLQDAGPVIYSQTRVGKNGRLFRLYKLRTMTVDADARLADLRASDPCVDFEWRELQKLRNDPRITMVGAFLRRSCVDELPQLVNVLRGEMSVVGPRPITDRQISEYGRRFAAYASVRPGLTGLWQVCRQDHPSFRSRIAADRLYLRRKSFAGDLMIILKTIPVVISGRGCR